MDFAFAATLATPTNHLAWLNRVNRKIKRQIADEERSEYQKIQKKLSQFEIPEPVVRLVPVLTDAQKRLCVLRTQAGLTHGYWLSSYCQKLPDQVRVEQFEKFVDLHLLPFLRTNDAFAGNICSLAFCYDLSSSAAFIKGMNCTPQKLFEFICK